METETTWYVARDAVPDYVEQYSVIDEATGETVATVRTSRADADAIAAAPDLLAALQSMVQFAIVFQVDYPDKAESVQVKIDAARAAIAKATGE
jgi:hypothetical protein